MEKKNFLITNFDLSICLIIYSILAIFSINYYHFNLGTDGISYLSIAENYVNGCWSLAINGYWSPLYSWLLTPIIFFDYNVSTAPYVTRIVSLVAGFVTIISLNRLSLTFNLNRTVKKVLLITSIPMILFYSIFKDTPDVLVVCLLVYYFSFIFDENYPNYWINGAICGFLGGMGFLTKTYIFPFFMVHFLFFNFLYYFKGLKKNRKGVKKNLIVGLVVFLAISGIWITTLSLKYDKPTIGTTTEYNHAIVGPEYGNHPVYSIGLIRPPNPSATSTWEEPSLVKLNDWSPFESREYFEFQLKLTKDNLLKTAIIFEYYSLLSLAIIFISLYFILKLKTERSFKNRLIYIMLTIFIYSSGYLLIFVEERYLWPAITLMMFCGFYIISTLYKEKNLSLKFRNIFLVILMVSFIFTPAFELFIYPSTDNGLYDLSKTLQNDYGLQGNIASNGHWENTLAISYYLNNQYYGLPKNIIDPVELKNELIANNITYYFVWGDSNNVQVINYNELTNGRIQGLRIYGRTYN